MKKENISSVANTIGIAYNLKSINNRSIESEAEYDDLETIDSLKKVIIDMGFNVVLLEANKDLFKKLFRSKPDLVFNIAEGAKGRSRESQVPGILSFLGIPYSGSEQTSLGIALDKSLTKRLLGTHGIKSPKSELISSSKDEIDNTIKFPVIVKPNAEGSSKGIGDDSVVEDIIILRKKIKEAIEKYEQPIIVEEYIEGREFAVGVLCNDEDIEVLLPMEISVNNKYNIYSHNVKINFEKYVTYKCPANISHKIEKDMMDTAKKIYVSLECKDFARIDFRLGEGNEVFFLEINPLPGLKKGYSDLAIMAEYNDISYSELIKKILESALKRNGFRNEI